MKHWYQLKVQGTSHDLLEALSEQLEEAGALSITLEDRNDDPVLEPLPGTMPLWPEVVLVALFDEQDLALTAEKGLAQSKPELSTAIELLADQDWQSVWMSEYKAQLFGNRLWVGPSWEEKPNRPEFVHLVLDPGLAFGSGTHPTTKLCLNWLAKASLTGKTLIDYGCGSGILALAALKLGAKQVWGVDIDEQALIATKNNSLANQIDEVELAVDYPENLKEPVDCIIANILLTPLLSLQHSFAHLLLPGGKLVLSGILKEQVETLINHYTPSFRLIEVQEEEDWALVSFLNPNKGFMTL